MSRLYDTEEALNLILSDDGEADSDSELAEPVCPGSDEEFDFDIDDQELFGFNQRYKKIVGIQTIENNATKKL